MSHDREAIRAAKAFWNLPVDHHLAQLNSSELGLSSQEAQERLERYGADRLNGKNRPASGAYCWHI